MIFIKKQPAKQKQYGRRETIELMGLPDSTNNGKLKEAPLQTLEETEVKVMMEFAQQREEIGRSAGMTFTRNRTRFAVIVVQWLTQYATTA